MWWCTRQKLLLYHTELHVLVYNTQESTFKVHFNNYIQFVKKNNEINKNYWYVVCKSDLPKATSNWLRNLHLTSLLKTWGKISHIFLICRFKSWSGSTGLTSKLTKFNWTIVSFTPKDNAGFLETPAKLVLSLASSSSFFGFAKIKMDLKSFFTFLYSQLYFYREKKKMSSITKFSM